MPGTEGAFPYTWWDSHPEDRDSLIGGVYMEHLGMCQFRELGDTYEATGLPAHTYVFGFDSQLAVDTAIKAVKDNGLPRAQVDVATSPGVHGLPQQGWLGFNRDMDSFGIPGWEVTGDWTRAGFQTLYPAVPARFDVDPMRTQAAVPGPTRGQAHSERPAGERHRRRPHRRRR